MNNKVKEKGRPTQTMQPMVVHFQALQPCRFPFWTVTAVPVCTSDVNKTKFLRPRPKYNKTKTKTAAYKTKTKLDHRQ